jgi:hypothetical protein
VDQGTLDPPIAGQAQGTPATDGLADRVATVHAARERLGRDLDRLNAEVRAEMGHTMERMLWKFAAGGAALVAGLAVRKALTAVWLHTQHREPPEDVAKPGTGWGEAAVWTVATAVGMGLAKLVATRGAAAGWQRAKGTPPPV